MVADSNVHKVPILNQIVANSTVFLHPVDSRALNRGTSAQGTRWVKSPGKAMINNGTGIGWPRIDRIYGYLNFETRLYGVLCKKLCTW